MNLLPLALLALPASPSAATATLSLVRFRDNAHEGAAVQTVDIFVDSGVQCIASGADDGTLNLWALDNIEPLSSAQLTHEIYNLDATEDFDFPLVVTGEGGWNGGPDGDTLRAFSAKGVAATTAIDISQIAGYIPGGYTYCVAISPSRNGKVLVASSGYYGDVNIRELECSSSTSCTLLDITPSIETNDRRVDAIKFFPSSPNLADPLRFARSLKNEIFIYEENGVTGAFDELGTLSHPGTWENFFDVSPDGAMLVSGTDGNGGTIKTYDLSIHLVY